MERIQAVQRLEARDLGAPRRETPNPAMQEMAVLDQPRTLEPADSGGVPVLRGQEALLAMALRDPAEHR